MPRVKVNKANSLPEVAKRIEAELRKFNKDKRVNSIAHLTNKTPPPTCDWANNPWLVEQIRKQVGTGE